MGEIIVRKVRGMNWMAKISLVLIFTMVFSTFMYQGWYKPGHALAAGAQFLDGASVTVATTETTIGNLATTLPAGDNLVIAIVSLRNATATVDNFAANAIKLKKGTTVLDQTLQPFRLGGGTTPSATVFPDSYQYLVARDVGAAANATYTVTGISPSATNTTAEVKIIVINGLPSSALAAGASTAVGTTATTLATVTPGFTGTNVIIARVELNNTNAAARNLAATTGLRLLKDGTTVLDSNQFQIDLNITGNAKNSMGFLLLGVDSSAVAGSAYSVSATGSNTGINGDADILVINGLDATFTNGGTVSVGNTQATLATQNTTYGAGDNVVITSEQFKASSTTARTIAAGAAGLYYGTGFVSTNQYIINAGVTGSAPSTDMSAGTLYFHSAAPANASYSSRATASGTIANGNGSILSFQLPTPPVAGTVAVSPDTGTYTSGSPTITAVFTGNAVTSCEYTTNNGTNWYAGVLTGSSPNYTCTATPTGLTGSLTINMRATSPGGTGTATAITRTVDNTGPTTGTLTVTPGTDQNVLTWTASTDSQSGLRTGSIYDVRVLPGITPPSCTTGTSIYTGDLLTFTHINMVPATGGYSYRVCAYDNMNNPSTGATGTGLPHWGATITTCDRCHSYPPRSGARNNPEGAVVGSHDVHTNVCSTCHVAPGASDYAHRDGNINMNTGSTGISGGFYDKANTGVFASPADETFAQTNLPTTRSCRNISCHGGNNPTPVWGAGTAGCVDCHSAAITRTKGVPGGTLSQITGTLGEFGLAWGHKKSGRGTVTNSDCIVCHLEGNYTTQRTSAKHADGNIDLRDPDGTGETPITNISGGAFTFTKFSISYAANSRTTTGHTSDTDVANVITQKFCLACHDSDASSGAGKGGASNPTARTAGGTALMPWGGVNLGANYTVANGAAAAGGVIDAMSQFATGNASKHPIRGPRSAGYPTNNRLASPYNNFTRTAGTLANSVVMNCFDCHTTGTSLTTRTIVAHGNAATVLGTVRVSGTPSSTNYPTLCRACHVGYETTNTGNAHDGTAYPGSSAFGAGTGYDGGMDPYPAYGCFVCHTNEAGTATPGRPIEAQNVHGYPSTLAGGTTYKVAFIRGSQAVTGLNPQKIGATTYTVQCVGMGGGPAACNSSRTEVYAPGGVY